MNLRILVDGSNLIHRLWHTNPPDLVLNGVLNQLRAITQSLRSSDLSVALDRSGPSWRRELCPAYKSGRAAKPGELYDILALSSELITQAGFECDAVPGFEADDIIATWSRIAVDDGQQAVIVSADKDLYQCLVSGRVTILRQFRTRGGSIVNPEYFTESMFFDKYGLGPHEWPTLRAIMGDPSDRMPGVPGIGESGAIELMRKYATVDEVMDAFRTFAHVPLSQRQSIAFRAAYRSGDLAKWVRIHTLATNVPFTAESPA